MFAPEDLEIVKGTPGVRRRFLDMEIGQVAPSYLFHLQQYQKVLVQRNNLLKQLWGRAAPNKRCWTFGTANWQNMVLKSSRRGNNL